MAFRAVGLCEDKLVPGERLTITGNILTIVTAEVWVFEERGAAIHSAIDSRATTNKIMRLPTSIEPCLDCRGLEGKEKGEAHKETEG